MTPGSRLPLAWVIERSVKVEPTVPPVLVKLLVTERLPVPFSVPPLILSAAIEEVPFSESVPAPDTISVPPPFVAPETASEPPETFRELLELMASPAMLSVPVAWVTA